jgi:hypothetical protein
MDQPLPSVGRIVHYFTQDGAEVRPAIITRVWSPECVNLQVFGEPLPNEPQGMFPTSVMKHLDGAQSKPRTWTWPPRA